MIHELRIYTCLPGRLPALQQRFETATLAIWGATRHPLTRLLDDDDRFFQQRSDLPARMAVAGGARAEMGRVHRRSGVAGSEGEERGGWADRGQHRQFAAAADTLLPRLLQTVGITATWSLRALMLATTTNDGWVAGSAADAVADVRGLGCIDHPNDLQLDARW